MFSRPLRKLRPMIAAAAFVAALLALLGALAWQEASRPDGRTSDGAGRMANFPPLPMPEPQDVKELTPEQAKAANDALPFAENALERALSFTAGENLSDPLAYRAALDCLTAAVYYEAGGEGEQGQRAVAQVVLNRVRHPAYPARICEVVYQGSERRTGCQFTFTCDGSLARQPNPARWERAQQFARSALAGAVESSVGLATHYHADFVVPYWASGLDKITAVGAHIFYRWKGYWGHRQAFSQRYLGEVASLPAVTSSIEMIPGDEGEASSGLAPSPGPLGHLRATLVQSSRPVVIEDQARREPIADEGPARLMIENERSRLIADRPPAL